MIRAEDDHSVLIDVKAVPGARSDAIAGPLGDRLKVRTAAPPEGGKANRAICALLAAALGLKPRDLEIVSGSGSPEKTVRARGVSHAEATTRLRG